MTWAEMHNTSLVNKHLTKLNEQYCRFVRFFKETVCIILLFNYFNKRLASSDTEIVDREFKWLTSLSLSVLSSILLSLFFQNYVFH